MKARSCAWLWRRAWGEYRFCVTRNPPKGRTCSESPKKAGARVGPAWTVPSAMPRDANRVQDAAKRERLVSPRRRGSMGAWLRLIPLLLFAAIGHGEASPGPPATATSAAPLAGLWQAKRTFDPDVSGTLRVTRSAAGWTGEFAGRTASGRSGENGLAFEFPGGEGTFLGDPAKDGSRITGHWIQPGNVGGGPFASPVVLSRTGPDDWRGAVVPLGMEMTFYLLAKARSDGALDVFLRNPDRNVGFFQIRVDRLERDGNAVKLIAAGQEGKPDRVVLEGRYDPENDRLSIDIPGRGGTYDFRRVGNDEYTDFYPRGRPSAPYVYSPPSRWDDGWETAPVEDVGIDRAAISKFVQKLIDMPMDSAGAPEIHGVLIARHGKLVLEEYFHGYHRERAHDTRSAGKSLASDLAGAAIQAGNDLSASTPVYAAMNGGTAPPGLDPRKRAMTLEHLLTMSSGFDCDEENESSPGYEDNVTGPDVYRQTLDLPMVRAPGEKAVYCSVGANLAGGVVARAAHEPSLRLFQRLIAEPLGIERYYLGVSPTNDAYYGGGARLMPRDFLKLAQVHVDGGHWHGRRVYSADWSRKATSPITRFSEEDRKSTRLNSS